MSNKVRKALPYIIVNLVGAALSVLSCFFDIIAIAGLIFALSPFYMIAPAIEPGIILIIFATPNIAACAAVIANKSAAGLTLAILFGSFGAAVGTLFNRNYKYAKAVRVIFNAHLWIGIWICVSLLYVGGHF